LSGIAGFDGGDDGRKCFRIKARADMTHTQTRERPIIAKLRTPGGVL
jgi:hypothetical protein